MLGEETGWSEGVNALAYSNLAEFKKIDHLGIIMVKKHHLILVG